MEMLWISIVVILACGFSMEMLWLEYSTIDCKLVMSCGSFDVSRLHLLAKMMLVMLFIFTRHGVRSQGELRTIIHFHSMSRDIFTKQISVVESFTLAPW